MVTHLVRVGFAGNLVRATYPESLPRGCEVLLQTPRGRELAKVLATLPKTAEDTNAPPRLMTIVRPVSVDDRRLIERLCRHKVRAVRRCQAALAVSGSSVRLLDVDQLLDGGTLVLHFLGQPSGLDRELTDTILREYEAEVQSIPLSERMLAGCGEGCGADASDGHDTAARCGGACAGCSLAAACGISVATTVNSTR